MKQCIFYFFVPFGRCGSGPLGIVCGTTAAPVHSIKRVDLQTVRIRSMKRLVHLVRHGTHAEVGKVLSGRSGIALDARGRAEAEALAAHLARLPVASLHSSPRRRARETAAPIMARTGLDIRIADALDEVDFGNFTGSSFADLADNAEWQNWNARRGSARCPHGETMAEAVARAWDYVTHLPEAEMPALCVTHCDIIRGLVTCALGLAFDRIFSFDCDPGSLTTLSVEGSDVRLVALNLRA
jgi:probable phosphoglycerate mutase